MRVLATSLSIRPTYTAASNLGTAAFYLGQYAEAARAFERALAIDDRDYRVWRNLAAARYWAAGERGGAAPAYERAAHMAEQERAVNPSSAEILSDLADCYAMLGRGGKARALLGSALDEAPADVSVMARAIEVFERLGDRAAALRWIERALAAGLQPDLLERTPGLGELRADPRYLALLRPADGSRHRALTKGGSP
jgi:tetratricopeptide (TPR) repeat protein